MPTGASRKHVFYYVDTESNSSTSSSERVGSETATWDALCNKMDCRIFSQNALFISVDVNTWSHHAKE